MMQGMKRTVPMGSNCFERSENPIEFSLLRGGDLKNNAIPRMVIAPIGKLI